MVTNPEQDFVLKTIESRDVHFVRFWFTDVLGHMKSFAVIPSELDNAFQEGMGFDGSCIEGFSQWQEADMLAFPDPSTFQVLPWRPQSNAVARMICSVRTPDGRPFEGDPRYVLEYPSRLFGICATSVPGEYAFSDVAYDRTSFGHLREKAKEYVGTQSALWGITAGVYLAQMGPDGMREVDETILANAQYAAGLLCALEGVALRFSGPFFKEFVVDFNRTGRTVAAINRALLAHGIFGGRDLSADFPALGQCALYCVTEIHTKEDIERLRDALRAVLA